MSSKTFAASLTLALAAWATPSAQAATYTIDFSASGFQNAGVAAPGVGTHITGTMSWEAASPSDAIGTLTAFDMAINGHAYTLAEIGIANEGTPQTAFGGLVNGANAVVGNGAADDFLIVFDRLTPSIQTFAFSVLGYAGSIWWTPTFTSMRYVNTNHVPEPATALLVVVALGAAVVARRKA
jgi:hypothetical protein